MELYKNKERAKQKEDKLINMKKKKLKLTIELVPSTVWYSSLYEICKRNNRSSIWRKIKKEIFKKEGKKCWICGEEKRRLEAHEFWEYDDKNHIQKLVAIHHLCDMCHRVKHMGFWTTFDGMIILTKAGLNKDDLIKHFCKVNKCSIEEFKKHEKEAVAIWKERSKYEWKQDFGEYAPIVIGMSENKNKRSPKSVKEKQMEKVKKIRILIRWKDNFPNFSYFVDFLKELKKKFKVVAMGDSGKFFVVEMSEHEEKKFFNELSSKYPEWFMLYDEITIVERYERKN